MDTNPFVVELDGVEKDAAPNRLLPPSLLLRSKLDDFFEKDLSNSGRSFPSGVSVVVRAWNALDALGADGSFVVDLDPKTPTPATGGAVAPAPPKTARGAVLEAADSASPLALPNTDGAVEGEALKTGLGAPPASLPLAPAPPNRPGVAAPSTGPEAGRLLLPEKLFVALDGL